MATAFANPNDPLLSNGDGLSDGGGTPGTPTQSGPGSPCVEGGGRSGSISPRARRQPKRALALLPLVALIFYDVSGGPFGTEEAIKSGGPLLAIIGFIVLPFLWSVPEALLCAELATAFPENSGYVAWVSAAFGPFWGFQEGFLSWISGVTDNAIYPVMMASYIKALYPSFEGPLTHIVFYLGVTLVLTYLNYRGLDLVGRIALTLMLFIMLPFIILIVLGVPHVEPKRWLEIDLENVDWLEYANVMFWNLNYWDSVSTLAGEVPNPGKTFPRAMLYAVITVIASYLLPLLIGTGIDIGKSSEWTLGHYVHVADRITGPWLGIWIVLAAAVSQVGQFQAEMSSDSYQVQGMAERGFLPKMLSRKSAYNTPTIGILMSSAGILLMVLFDFMEIVELLNAVYCLAELLEFAAFIYLRIKAPRLHRPFKVPGPTWLMVVMLLPASCLLLGLVVAPFWVRHTKTMLAIAIVVPTGLLLYPLLQVARARGWCEFNDLMHEIDEEHLETEEDRQGLLFDPDPSDSAESPHAVSSEAAA